MPDGNGAVFAFARMPIWKALAADYLSSLLAKVANSYIDNGHTDIDVVHES